MRNWLKKGSPTTIKPTVKQESDIKKEIPMSNKVVKRERSPSSPTSKKKN